MPGTSQVTKHRGGSLPSDHIFYSHILSGPNQDGFPDPRLPSATMVDAESRMGIAKPSVVLV